MEFYEAVEKIKVGLDKTLPGKSAQALMAPVHRSLDVPPNMRLKKSAVLLHIYNKNNEPYIVFMRRPVYNGPHSGQISFPGGKYEKEDASLKDTALREAKEELGIQSEDVDIIGQLTPLVIPHSKFIVYPYIGICKKDCGFIPDKQEVEEILECSIKNLLKDDIIGEYEFQSHTGSVLAPYFDLNGHKLWGATSMILSEFLVLLK